MSGQERSRSLAEIMKTTDWWPLDLPSIYEGEVRGQVVLLEQIKHKDWAPFAWHVHSEMTDLTSLPIPFKGYNLLKAYNNKRSYENTAEAAHCRVLVATRKGSETIDPLTDCCALVPFDPINDRFLTPQDRIEFAQEAIQTCLMATRQWPYPVKTLAELFPQEIRLEPGKPVAYNPTEWISDLECGYRDAVVRTYSMSNLRVRADFGVMVATGKEQHPASIDPYRDCFARFDKPSLLTRIHFRLYGLKAASTDELRDLAQVAIVAFLDKLGVWPPRP